MRSSFSTISRVDRKLSPLRLICCFFALLSNGFLFAQSPANSDIEKTGKRSYQTEAALSPIIIDGLFNDQSWDQVEWTTDFIQSRPNDGAAPTSQTAFKVLYDNKNLYIAARCFDSEPDKIEKRMSRRDGFAGDLIEVNIDSYHDLRTAFSFTASVSGVKGDEFISRDGNDWDRSWNPIWDVKTQIDSLGWTAELEIPLSQLRFSNKEEQIWGLQFMRHDFRNESRSNWEHIPQNSGFWVSGFGELHGIKGIKPKRQIEIQPYILGQHTNSKKIEGHPFKTGNDSKLTVGLDGKIGITNDLTVDFTINPDFGQVEADPSALTLDGFEIFFEERRPFFIENRNIFNYNISNSNASGRYDNDNLFYSRRIGSSPHRYIFEEEDDNYYVDQPDFTSILGAAKFSGKTNKGLSIGIIESITQRETATIQDNGVESEEVVEPLTNYSVLRLQQDINEGQTVIGGILTGVHRDLDNQSELDYLHKAAYTGGLDFLHQWNNRKWRLNASIVSSRVEGSELAITETQQAFAHGFGRPNADHISIDSLATALSGTGGNISLGKYGSKLQFQLGATFRSPGLELNDIGFLQIADEINQYFWAGYRWTQPFSIFRNLGVNFGEWARWDFGGRFLHQSLDVNAFMDFTNFWSTRLGLNFETNDISNTWLRGGPSFRKPIGLGGFLRIDTDSRKAVKLSLNINGGRAYDRTVNGYNISPGVELQFSDAINVSTGLSWNRSHREDQYVSTEEYEGSDQYIISELLQKTLSFTLRVNYNITPDLTIQYYGQPFISRGVYSDFKFVNDPLAKDVYERFKPFSMNQINYDTELDSYKFDENADGIIDYSISNPDFDFVQFRSNLVARWEYKPGSEIYLVWSQGSTAFTNELNESVFDSLKDNLWDDSLTNTFLVKLTYRFTN